MDANSFLAGAKGRAAFCDVSGIPKGSKQPIDYSVCPLSTHGNLMLALIQSGISGYPNRLVVTQFYETVARYGDFFKVRKECVLPVLEVFMGNRYAVKQIGNQVVDDAAQRHTKSEPRNTEARLLSVL